jgi:hypothetical protein
MLQQQTPNTMPQSEIKPDVQPPAVMQPQVGPVYNDQFLDTLTQRLMPRLTQQLHLVNTRAYGMSLALAIVSLVLMTVLVAMFLFVGSGVDVTGVVTVGTGMGIAERMIGIGIVCLTVLLINLIFNFVVFREKH